MAKRSAFARKLPTALAGLAAAALLAGCANLQDTPQTIFVPKGPVSRSLLDLHILIGWLSLVVFVGVMGLLIYMIVAYRRRNETIPPQIHGNTRLEIMWTLAPVVVLAIFAVPTISLISQSPAPPPERGQPLNVTVVGHQWWWEFIYPSLGITTANDLNIPTGQPIMLTLESKDVIHSFWVPALGGKQDAIPNRRNTMWFVADEPGTYLGQCTEYCGFEHALMRNRAVVRTPQDFQAWATASAQPAAPPAGGDAARGAQLFTGNAGCSGCHTVQGLRGAVGQVGPNLTHFASRTSIAAGVLENNHDNLVRWISNPEEVKPGNDMKIPRPLAPDEVQALAAFVESLK